MKTLMGMAIFSLAVVLLPTVASASLNLEIGANKPYYVGKINGWPSPSPASEAEEAAVITKLISVAASSSATIDGRLYERSSLAGPFAALDPENGSTGIKEEGGTTLLNLGSVKYQYILAKYDGPNWGSEVWYFPNGISGEVSVPQYPPGYSQYEVSHISAYNVVASSVPEPGTFAVWGLLALSAVVGTRKWRQMA